MQYENRWRLIMNKNSKSSNADIPSDVMSLLKEYEKETAYYNEDDISSVIRKFIATNEQLPDSVWFALKAEHMAFNFTSRYIHSPDDLDKYFAPKAIDIYGRFIEEPMSKPEITKKIIEYWQKRCQMTMNPILRARYADLIWQYGAENFVDRKTRIMFAKMAIDSYLYRFDSNLYGNCFEAENILKRTLYLALKLNDKNRVRKTSGAFFKLFQQEADVSKPGTWGFLYDNIYGRRNIPLTKQEIKIIIKSLEDFLYQTTNHSVKAKFSPWSAQTAVKRLIKYYHSQGMKKDVHRVVKRYGLAFEKIAQEADALLAMAWLQPIYELYRNEGLRKDAKRVQLILKAKGKDAHKSMKKVETKVIIDQKEVNRYLTAMSKGGLYASLTRLVFEFTPKIEQAKKALKELDKKSPLLLRISRTTISDEQITAKVGSIEYDLEGHLIVQIAENISLTAWMLEVLIDKLKKKYKLTAKKLTKFVSQSPIFHEESTPLLEKSTTYFLNNDYVGTIHVMIPQIENAFRCLLATLGEPTSKCVQPGIMQEKNLNDIFAEQKIKEFFPKDLLIYYKTFLSDPRGFNLRNRISHGLMKNSDFRRFYADRSLHILLSLALIRKK